MIPLKSIVFSEKITIIPWQINSTHMQPKKTTKPAAVAFIGFRHKMDSIIAAREAGHKVILITHKNDEKAAPLFDEVFSVDLKHREALLEVLPSIKAKYRVRGVLTNYEQYVVLRSFIAEHLGVPSCSVYAASCTRNKALQRHALEFLPENIPSYRVKTLTEAKKAFKSLGGDVFFKNIGGVKSKLIFHIQSEEELKKAFTIMKQGSKIPDEDLFDAYEYMKFHFEYPSPNETFLIEKAIDGKILVSVDSIVGSRRIWHSPSLVDNITNRMLGGKDSHISYRMLPSKLKPELIKKIKTVVTGAIRILGLRNCAVHTELMITKNDEVYLIELASRMGGYRQDMYQTAYGLDLSGRLIKAVLGEDIKTRKKHSHYVSIVEIFPKEEMALSAISGHDKLAPKEKAMICYEKARPVGYNAGPAYMGYSPASRMMIKGETYKAVEKLAQKILKTIKVE